MEDRIAYAVSIKASKYSAKTADNETIAILYEEEGYNRIAIGKDNIASERRDMIGEGCKISAATRIDITNLINDGDIDQEIVLAIEYYAGTCNSVCFSDELYVCVAFQWQDEDSKPYWFVIKENGSYDDLTKEQFDECVKELKTDYEEE